MDFRFSVFLRSTSYSSDTKYMERLNDGTTNCASFGIIAGNLAKQRKYWQVHEPCSILQFTDIMADRLTQLQDAVNQLADHFCNSIGILQQFAPQSSFPGFEKQSGKSPSDVPEDYAAVFSKLIARTAKDIDVLIDSLPSEDSSLELQLASLKKLENENQEEARKLEDVVNKGEMLLEQIQSALHEVAECQLRCQAMEANT